MTKKSKKDSQFLSLGQQLFGILALVLAIAYGLINAINGQGGTSVTQPPPSSSDSGSNQPAHIGKPTRTDGCVASGEFQDNRCTPGAIFTNATVSQICQSGYSASVRNVPAAVKDQVYAAYGIRTHTTGQYEVDHLISLELGGSNDIANLWPEAANPRPGFHEKDAVENYLHKQLCSGQMTLQQAQEMIVTNWRKVYDDMPSAQAESLLGDIEQECPEGCP